MALVELQKVQIIAHAGMKMDVLSSLQEEGIVQIEDAQKQKHGFFSDSPDLAKIDHTLYRLSQCLDFLAEREGKGFAKSLFAPMPQLLKKNRESVLDSDYVSVLERVETIERNRNDLVSQINFLKKEYELLVHLQALDVPINAVCDTERTAVQIGHLPTSKFEEMSSLAEEADFWFSKILSDKRITYLLVVHFKKDGAECEKILKEKGFSSFYFTDHVLERADDEDRVVDIMRKISEEIAELEEKTIDLERDSLQLVIHKKELMEAYDVLTNEKDKRLSSRLLGGTEKTFFLEGWIQSADIPKLKAKLDPFSDFIEFYFQQPDEEEEPPVVLQNPKVWRPFEIITRLYGLPQRGSMDPTIPLAPFFFVFVGLTVSEAGYGFLVALLSFFLIKLVKLKGGIRQFLILMTILGVAAVVLGTLVGGWFGFPIRQLLVLDPMKDPVSFLILSLALGFVQVWFGTLLKMISEIRRKNLLEAVFVQGGWLVLLPCLVAYGLTKTQVWGLLALVGAAGIVLFGSPSRNPVARFFGGLYKLYDISRYLADVLSYSRLLALGLATSVIAMVANTLSQTALGIPWVGWLLAALVFLGMHLFNLGISFLGGFVHSMRLQFVEFFSKFYTAGSKPFKPFELKSKYVEFVE
jgi:V/A-type H+-transporting ATPase subunit I